MVEKVRKTKAAIVLGFQTLFYISLKTRTKNPHR